MKKSQILAAIALAMALGVVAPVASTANSVYAAEQTTAQKAASDEIKAVKKSFGPITTYTDGKADDEALTGADAYKFYADNAATVTNASEIVSDLKKADGTIATALRAAVVGVADYDTYKDVKAVKDITSDANKWASADLGTVVANAKAIANAIVASADADDEDAVEAARKVAQSINDLVKDDVIANSINTAIAGDAKSTTLQTLYAKVTGKTSPVINNEATLNTVLSAVKAALPKVDLYNRINKQVTKVETALGDGTSDATLNEYVATLKKLVNGQITPDEADKENEKNDGVNAPATGVVGTAEGTATTVSIVAGLATALTALGAGVVAYRSARRK